MKVNVKVSIPKAKEEVWDKITNIEDSVNVISGIEKLEVLNKPESGFIGFKWRETRKMFGKEATEVMWITDCAEYDHYNVSAESHGSKYESVISVREKQGETTLAMDFTAIPQTTSAKVMSLLMGWMFAGPTKKALQQDLEDIKMSLVSN